MNPLAEYIGTTLFVVALIVIMGVAAIITHESIENQREMNGFILEMREKYE